VTTLGEFKVGGVYKVVGEVGVRLPSGRYLTLNDGVVIRIVHLIPNEKYYAKIELLKKPGEHLTATLTPRMSGWFIEVSPLEALAWQAD